MCASPATLDLWFLIISSWCAASATLDPVIRSAIHGNILDFCARLLAIVTRLRGQAHGKDGARTSLSSDKRGFMIFGPLAHTDSTEVTSNGGGSLASCAPLVVSWQSVLMAGTWGTMLRGSDSSAIDGRSSLRR